MRLKTMMLSGPLAVFAFSFGNNRDRIRKRAWIVGTARSARSLAVNREDSGMSSECNARSL